MNRERKLAHRRPGAAPALPARPGPGAVPQSRFSTSSTVAASELPPPRPPPTGMRLRTRMRAPRRTPVASCSGRAARTLRSASRRDARRALDALDARRPSRDLDADLVAPVEQLEQRLQVVITVGAPAGHVQEQVQLGRRRPPASRLIGRRQSCTSRRTRTDSRCSATPPRQPLRAGAEVVLVIDLPAVLLSAREPLLAVERFLAGSGRIAARRAASSAGSRAAARSRIHAQRGARCRASSRGRCWS